MLTAARPLRLIPYALANWAAIVALWFAAAHALAWPYPIWVLLLAGRFHALGVVLHDELYHFASRVPPACWAVCASAVDMPEGAAASSENVLRLRHNTF
jgi:hypothetical protein